MVFSSPTFLFAFLPIVLVAYFVSPRIMRNTCLLVASLAFYAWGEAFYVLLMLVAIAFNFALGLWVDHARRSRSARWVLAAAVAGNLSFLGWFKYANFTASNLSGLARVLGLGEIPIDPVHLPIGISFFTFQAISYIVDVYREEAPVERNPFRVALYISLFPQLIAGPIVRFRDIAGELASRSPNLSDTAYGIRRFVIGLGKKVLIANTLGRVADGIFGLPADELSTPVAWLGATGYMLQIYFDFSGYSDMAIGLGRIFGFHFLENFRHPYVSRSISEFWQRWHISLSTWFRDYLYIPLGGNRRGATRTYRNLLVVFVLCGLWHGASWNFLVWGLFHGAFLALDRAGRQSTLRFPAPLAHAWTLFVVLIGWVIFRCEGMDHVAFYLKALAGAGGGESLRYPVGIFLEPVVVLALGAGVIGCLPWLESLRRRWERNSSPALRWLGEAGALAGLVIVLVASAAQLASSTHNPFIYFRF